MLCQPLLKLHQFQWIGRCSQNLRKHWVWVKSDRRYEGVKLVRRYFDGSFFLLRRSAGAPFRDRAVRLLLRLSSNRRAHLHKQQGAQYGESVLADFLEKLRSWSFLFHS